MTDYYLAGVGLLLLVVGAEALVHGAVGIARWLRVSALLIGVTIVAYGTSTPELIVSINASLAGSYGIAVGNVIGSNTFNILFILGLTAVISPIRVSPQAIGRDGLFALIAAGLFIWIALEGKSIRWPEGIVFLAALLVMILFTYAQEQRRAEATPDAADPAFRPGTTTIFVLLIITGFGLLIIGADILVRSAISIARTNGVSETLIGLTLVAAGTSLPELATSVVAALRRNPDIALGNITGSNIYNILAILGIAALLGPVHIDPAIARIDMWVMLAATVALLVPMFFGNRMGRGYGLVLLIGYVGYVAYLFSNAGGST